MNKFIKIGFMGMGLGICAVVWADEHMNMPMRKDTKEFQQMKQLVGTWKGKKTGDAKDEPDVVEVDYKLTAGGSTLQETIMPGSPHEMVTMYHDEDGHLTLTHYCMMGNAPHMAVTKATTKEIQFNFIPGGHINPETESHMDALTLQFSDANHLAQKWVCHQIGKPDNIVSFNLTRAKA